MKLGYVAVSRATLASMQATDEIRKWIGRGTFLSQEDDPARNSYNILLRHPDFDDTNAPQKYILYMHTCAPGYAFVHRLDGPEGKILKTYSHPCVCTWEC